MSSYEYPPWAGPCIAWAKANGTLAQPLAARGAAYDSVGGLPGRRSEPGPNRLGGLDRRRPARDQAFERDDDLGVAPSDLTGGTDELTGEQLFNFMLVARARLSPEECDRFDEMVRLGHDADYKDIERVATGGGADQRMTGRAMDRRVAQDRRAVRAAVGELNSENFLKRYPDARRVSLSGNGR